MTKNQQNTHSNFDCGDQFIVPSVVFPLYRVSVQTGLKRVKIAKIWSKETEEILENITKRKIWKCNYKTTNWTGGNNYKRN